VASVYFAGLFGEFYSLVTNDAYNGIVACKTAESSGSSNTEAFGTLTTSMTTTAQRNYIPRGHTGVLGAVEVNKTGDNVKSGGALGFHVVAASGINYPNCDGGTFLSPIWINDPSTGSQRHARGRLRGVWQWMGDVSTINDGDIVPGIGDLAGKTFMLIKSVRNFNNNNEGAMAIEVSDTLETN
jgi:hypothetical protein